MIVHLYAHSWNEMRMLEFFFRHYRSWIDRFVFFDDNSTDGTIERLKAEPKVEIRPRPYLYPDSLVLSGKHNFDNCWKESRGKADWVVIVDIDEHLYHPDIVSYLETCKRRGVTLIPALGYEMLTDTFPQPDENLAQRYTRGAPTGSMSKLRIFNPDAITEVNFGGGGHSADPRGRLVYPERDELLLLHYKHLGLDYTWDRNKMLAQGLRETDRKNGWGFQYFLPREDYERVRARVKSLMVDISDPNYRPWRDHTDPRWWRNQNVTFG